MLKEKFMRKISEELKEKMSVIESNNDSMYAVMVSYECIGMLNACRIYYSSYETNYLEVLQFYDYWMKRINKTLAINKNK